MIDVKEAVRRSIDYLVQLQSLAGEKVQGLEVEEVEKPGEDHWLVTLSYLHLVDTMKGLVERRPRRYKVFRVDVETGNVESMSMRDVHASG